MGEFVNEKIIKKSRKNHKCDICGETIHITDSYKIISGRFDNHFFETKICEHCIPIHNKFCEIHRNDMSEGYSPDEVARDIMETVGTDCADYKRCINNCILCEWAVKKYMEYEPKKFWKD